MEIATCDIRKLLNFTPEEYGKILKFQEVEEKRLPEYIDMIEEWCKTQEHLVEGFQYMNRGMIERLFVLANGSIEGTKTKIDKLFTTKRLIPDVMLDRSFDEFQGLLENVICVQLPKLDPGNQTRCTVVKFLTNDWEVFGLLQLIRYIFTLVEIRLNYDFMLGERYIWDLQNLTISCLTQINPLLFKKAEIFATEVLGTKIKGIHILHPPMFVDKIVSMIKPFLKEKMANRIYIHNSIEELHAVVAKEILPKDYGGDAPSLSDLSDVWKNYMKSDDATKIIENSNKMLSDETKRSSVKFNEEYLGMPGSFRQLTVD